MEKRDTFAVPEGTFAVVDETGRATGEVRKNDPVSLTGERKKQHGDWLTQSSMADNLMFQVTHSDQWEHMGASRRQALFNIMQKVSRICSGDPEVEDHWDDIAGYAYLGKGGHGK